MNLLKASLLTAALATAPLAAHAESDFVDGAGNASAKLDFRVTIPRVLFLQVGTGTNKADNTAVDLIQFAPSAAALGTGAVAGTGGDLGNGSVTAKVRGNNGAIQLTATTAGTGLSNGDGDFIPFSEIDTASTPMASGGSALPAPELVNGASAPVTLTPASGKVVDLEARWTFSFANSAIYAPGTYGGAGTTNGGRVVYTAVMP
ncbi:hypothetical protein GCM10007067_27210 [Lysobacter bugurensis]|uniref:WxL domain-containing protein n=1 Tax=Cognatilysobacter bugurensis TaxID=543356 RepID=A0A918T741_9GAMM|nr:hypothetical protein GCM10007067_27210 [Lysobacter bugurensis]